MTGLDYFKSNLHHNTMISIIPIHYFNILRYMEVEYCGRNVKVLRFKMESPFSILTTATPKVNRATTRLWWKGSYTWFLDSNSHLCDFARITNLHKGHHKLIHKVLHKDICPETVQPRIKTTFVINHFTVG
jgi:hypothetical protein